MGCCLSSGFLVWPYDTTVLSFWHLWLVIKVVSEQLKLFLPVCCEGRSFSSFFKELLQLTSSFLFSGTTSFSIGKEGIDSACCGNLMLIKKHFF